MIVSSAGRSADQEASDRPAEDQRLEIGGGEADCPAFEVYVAGLFVAHHILQSRDNRLCRLQFPDAGPLQLDQTQTKPLTVGIFETNCESGRLKSCFTNILV